MAEGYRKKILNKKIKRDEIFGFSVSALYLLLFII